MCPRHTQRLPKQPHIDTYLHFGSCVTSMGADLGIWHSAVSRHRLSETFYTAINFPPLASETLNDILVLGLFSVSQAVVGPLGVGPRCEHSHPHHCSSHPLLLLCQQLFVRLRYTPEVPNCNPPVAILRWTLLQLLAVAKHRPTCCSDELLPAPAGCHVC